MMTTASPMLNVELLRESSVFDEDKFIAFRERARQSAVQPRWSPSKRVHIEPSAYIPKKQRLQLELRPQAANDQQAGIYDYTSSESKESEELDNTRVGWENRSTPSSQEEQQ